MKAIWNTSIFCAAAVAFALTGCATEQGDLQNTETSAESRYETIESALLQTPELAVNQCTQECLRGWARTIASCGGFGFNETTERCYRTSIRLVSSCVMDRCGAAKPPARTMQCMSGCQAEGEMASDNCSESKSTEAQCIEEGQEVYLTCFDAECAMPVEIAQPTSPEPSTVEPTVPTFEVMTCEDVCAAETESYLENCMSDPNMSSSTCASNARNRYNRCVSLTCE